MSNQTLLASVALAALCAAAMTLSPAHAAGQDGMVVVRDPQTGELRAPTAAESAALHGQSGLARKAPAQRVETIGPAGSRRVELGRSGLVYSVVTRDANGKLAEQCVNGEPAASAALHHPTPVKEPKHESE